MSYASVQSCTLSGIAALPVTVEVHIGRGLPGMSIVGLPQSAVRESKDRVKAAIMHVGLNYPLVKIVVNLAPADLPKQGGRFDLPIALGILVATGQLPERALANLVVLGELGLTGRIRSATGALPASLAYAGSDKTLLLPLANADEAALSQRTKLLLADEIIALIAKLKRADKASTVKNSLVKEKTSSNVRAQNKMAPSQTALNQFVCTDETAFNNEHQDKLAQRYHSDLSEVRGQFQAKRALEIAAAGSHNLIMVGPPGTGKSMLASRLAGIQPLMTELEAIETASIASISFAGFDASQWRCRPFRTPHHTASGVALVGGGTKPMPGEISLAHNGVLFLDELTEFPRAVLDVLREPMETGRISISRAARQADFPARFQLVAAMNPCPCGYHNDPDHLCRCSPDQIARYRMRLSGPFMDRIDLHVPVIRVTRDVLHSKQDSERSDTVRQRVALARAKQLERQQKTNNLLQGSELDLHCRLNEETSELLDMATEKLHLSMRATHKLLKVSRTLADLADRNVIEACDINEALGYRNRDYEH